MMYHMYHRLEYGGVVRIPESDLAVAVEVRDDTAARTPVRKSVRSMHLRQQFPKASRFASRALSRAFAASAFAVQRSRHSAEHARTSRISPRSS